MNKKKLSEIVNKGYEDRSSIAKTCWWRNVQMEVVIIFRKGKPKRKFGAVIPSEFLLDGGREFVTFIPVKGERKKIRCEDVIDLKVLTSCDLLLEIENLLEKYGKKIQCARSV